ncbi:MAG: TonB-dependent receptor [Cyclobacteriaceae bacterium]
MNLVAQSTIGNGKLTGIVMDPSIGQPIEYATIAILNPQTGQPINGTVADGKGRFTVKEIPNGQYNVSISFIGFTTATKVVEFSDKQQNVDLGIVELPVDSKVLEEVVVEGQRALIEDKVDRLVYNAENDVTSQGGDASDVLRRVPMLSVDLDGNVSLRGSENIRVLINNRPSTIMASGIADALKQIPAEEIKSVEVITSPSARYDAEGTAGIINIITKKNVLEGATLNVNSSFGYRGSNLGLSGGYKKGKLGVSLSGRGRSGYNILGSYENKQFTYDENNVEKLSTQNADTRSQYLYGNYTLGLDYDFNKKNYLTTSIRYGARNSNNFQDDLVSQTFFNNQLDTASLQNVETIDRSGTIDINMAFVHTFDKPQQELSILGQYSINDRKNDFENFQLDMDDQSAFGKFKNENQSSDEEITLQVDYQTPVGDNQMVEVGGKQIMRNVFSDYQYFSAVGDAPYQPITRESLSNVFTYQQDVTAGYVSHTISLPKDYTLKTGVRYEHTEIKAFFQDEQDIEIPSYDVWVPSVNFSKKLANNNTVKAAFNRRIQRPSIRLLNPNVQGSNPLNVTVGNPNLGPEYTNNYELGYSTFVKSTTLNFSTYIRNTSEALQRVSDVVGGDTIRTTYQNIGTENAYGASLFANVNLNDKFTLSGGTDVYYLTLQNNVPDPVYNASNEGWVMSLRMFGNYKLKNDWALQFFGFYRGRRVQLQGFRGGFGVYSLSIQKELPNKRGSFGIGAENFFTPEFRINSETISPVINQYSTDVTQRLNFKGTLNLRFGKIDNQGSRRKRKTINNDDLSDGGGDGLDDGNDGGGSMGQSRSVRPTKQSKPKKEKKEKNKN